MSEKKCDNFGDFFVYRLDNLLKRGVQTDQERQVISNAIKAQETPIKDEFNFYVDARVKANGGEKKHGKVATFLLEAWRPIMMYLFMYIIGQYYIINPIIEFFWPVIKLKELPAEMWTLLTVAVGGYITSRGVEKGIQIWRQNSQQQVIIPGETPMWGEPQAGPVNQGGWQQPFADNQGAPAGSDELDPTVDPTDPQVGQNQGQGNEENMV